MRGLAAATALVCTLTAIPCSAEGPARGVVALSDPSVRFAFHKAYAVAARRLEDAACREVLFDFGEGTGRMLSERLRIAGSAAAFLGTLSFAERDESPSCRGGAYAHTYPGVALVFLCGQRFKEATKQDAGFGATILIHEMLHSLGLGEGPPSSREITAAVKRRCRAR